MKSFFYSMLASSFLLLCSCAKNNEMEELLCNNAEEQPIIVGINLSGDIDIEETMLTRAENDSRDLLGIQVYKNGSAFCYGLFNNLNDVRVALAAGATYTFECTLVKNGVDVLYSTKFAEGLCYSHYNAQTSNGYKSFALYPFTFSTVREGVYCTNRFIYSSEKLTKLSGELVTLSGSMSGKTCGSIDRLYGNLTDYTPTVDGVLELPLKRVSFGIKVKVSGITDGSVSVTCKNNYNTFYSNSNITSNIESEGQLFSMYNIYDAWQYADADYQEAVELGVVWTRGNGIVQNLGTKTAYVKRNVMNIIKVRLSKNDTDVDVDVDPEEGDMGGEEEDLSN